jgi:hypothetical protein
MTKREPLRAGVMKKVALEVFARHQLWMPYWGHPWPLQLRAE